MLGLLDLPPLTVNGQRVGDLSGLAWDDDEGLLYALSDHGALLTLRPAFRIDRLVDVCLVRVAPLIDPLTNKPVKWRRSDSEGLDIVNGRNGRRGDAELLVSFEREPRIARYAHTRHTITEPRRLKRELAAVRSRGIALDNEELDLGVKCVAAPIRDRTGAVVAAISLSGPAQRFTPAAIRRFEKEIKQAAMEISRMLGLVPPAPSGKPLAEKEDRENAFLAAGRPRPPIRQYALDR